jgi:hypothetical protein
MKSHFNYKHNANPITFDCPHCPYRVKDKRNLRFHLVSKHHHVTK